MKRLGVILIPILIFLSTPIVIGAVSAASFTFDKTSVTVNVGDTFQVAVNEDAGTDQTNSSQTYILYDATLLEAQSVTAGSYFPVVSNNIESGKVFIVGYVDGTSTTLYKTGSGVFATVTFKALKNGTGTLTFDCRSGVSDSSQIIKYNDANATNLITCADNNTATVTAGTGATPSEPTPTTATDSADTGGSTLPQTGIMDHFNTTSIIGIGFALLAVLLRLAL